MFASYIFSYYFPTRRVFSLRLVIPDLYWCGVFGTKTWATSPSMLKTATSRPIHSRGTLHRRIFDASDHLHQRNVKKDQL
jgi:hypothetical protein